MLLKRLSILLFLIFNILHANIILDDNIKKLDNFEIKYLYDTTASLSIDTIKTTKFSKIISNQFAMGYKEGTSWFKIKITNKGDNEEFILYLTEPFLARD
jgi:hypothetical protein